MLRRKCIGSSLLIAGTCIGAGMLALPMSMATMGFYGALAIMVGVWALMTYAASLVVEVNLWLPENTSYISMAKHTLGRVGEVCTWLVIVCMLYALLAAYITAGGALLKAAMVFCTQSHMQNWIGYLGWTIIFAIIVYFGMGFSENINRIFMLGLIATFACLAATVAPHAKLHLLAHINFHYILAALPIIFVSFGYHVVLPSIRDYLHSHKIPIYWTIAIGSLLPLLMYAVWVFLIFATIPMLKLIHISHMGQPINALMQAIVHLTHNIWLHTVVRFFVFFAIASSFVGASLGLFDLLADGLKLKKTTYTRVLLMLLTYGPPLVFALVYPNGFILALSYAGVFVAISHGILPVMMTWSGRYCRKLSGKAQYFCGSRIVLILVFLAFCLVIFAQLGINLHWIPVA